MELGEGEGVTRQLGKVGKSLCLPVPWVVCLCQNTLFPISNDVGDKNFLNSVASFIILLLVSMYKFSEFLPSPGSL